MTNNDLAISRTGQNGSPLPSSGFAVVANDFFATVQESTLVDYWRMLLKRRRMIVYSALTVFALVAIITLKMTRQYEAVARIIVSRDNGDVISDQITQQAGGGGGGGGDINTEIETQSNIIRSDSLGLRVIQDLHLYREPDFAGNAANSDYDTSVTPLGSPPDMDPRFQEQLLKRFRDSLTVIEVPNTRIIEVHFFSPNPALAAAVAKQISETLAERAMETRYESTTRATEWLSQQLDELQHTVEEAEQKLVDYQKTAGIVGLDDKQNTIMTKLDDLNHALTLVQADRATKQANYESIQGKTPDMSAAVPATSQIYKLRQEQTDLKGQYAQVMAQYGDQYPKAVAIANQLKELELAITEENQRIAGELKSDFEISKSRENSLNDVFERSKQDAINLSERSVQYKILERDAESFRDLYQSLAKTLKQAQVLASLQSSNIGVVDDPIVPSQPSRPNIPRNLAFGAVLGMAIGMAGAFMMEIVDNRIYRAEEIPNIANLSVLVSIPVYQPKLEEKPGQETSQIALPQPVGLISWMQPRSEWAEAYRALRTAILLSGSNAPPKTLLITSGLEQEGKSTTSLNLATVLAQRGGRVLLVDADLRRPSIHVVLGLNPQNGLSTVLTGVSTLEDAVIPSVVPNLSILPAGPLPPSPADLFGSEAMKQLLERGRDAPPVLSVTDAVILSVEVDGVVVVVRAGSSTKHCIRRTRDLLSGVGARILGTVVNALSMSAADSYYYYGKSRYSGYYSYYSASGERQKPGGNGSVSA